MADEALSLIAKIVLEQRLTEWAREYGGGRYVTMGFSTGEHILARLITFGGFMPSSSAPCNPDSLTAADEVEQTVKRLAKTWPGHALVLRCDYFCLDMALDSRLDWLRRHKVKASRASYYQKLESSKLYVAGSL